VLLIAEAVAQVSAIRTLTMLRLRLGRPPGPHAGGVRGRQPGSSGDYQAVRDRL